MTKTLTLCPGCGKRIPAKDACDPLCILGADNNYWHRVCHLATTPEYGLMERLFRLQDDWKEDPETALADLIGNLGHFATIQGIDFEEAVSRGLSYHQAETRIA